MFDYKTIIFRLILAAVLGALLGTEREINNRPAGLRTHALVSLGSALIMLVSIDGFSKLQLASIYQSSDPARLAAQVISGIGFLGAGTIIHNQRSIAGLTTAACLWVSAGIGLAVGVGYYTGAVVASLLSLIVLIALRRMEIMVTPPKERNMEIIIRKNSNLAIQILNIVKNKEGKVIHMAEIKDLENDEHRSMIKMRYQMRKLEGVINLISTLQEHPDVIEIRHSR
ncbi:Mg2+ transporter-C family protein [Peptostreptococcaceae bacterium oral taxon 113 str. W5053]|nr:Mg2+ transporter-C family protein [Peptostreptococcaceae bacterium oral taxon 113 str. W5053]